MRRLHVFASRSMSAWEAGALFALFALQFPFPQTEVRLVFSAIYLAVALVLFVRPRRAIAPIVRSVFGWTGSAGEPAPRPEFEH